MPFSWKTDMRGSDDPDRAGLIGQAAATVHEDGRVTLLVMSDRGTFHSSCIISADDAQGLAWVLLGEAGREKIAAGARQDMAQRIERRMEQEAAR